MYEYIWPKDKVNAARMEPESIKYLLTTISLSQSQEKNTKACHSAVDHNRKFVCKITEESSQPCSYIAIPCF